MADRPDDPTPLHTPPDPELERRVREVLARRAAEIRPRDRFAEIQAEASRGRPVARRRLLAVLAAAAIVVVAGVVVLPQLGQPDSFPASAENNPGTVPIPSPPPSRSAASGASPSQRESTPQETGSQASSTEPDRAEAVPVYYLGSTLQRTEAGTLDHRVRLFREFHRMPVSPSPFAKVAAAVGAMSTTRLDPDYRTAWTTLGDVAVTEVAGDLRIDLAADGFPAALPDSFTAAEAIQQLVWTATAAYGKDVAVTVVVDGGTNVSWGKELFGTPVSRDADLRAPVWITDPASDQHDQAGRVTVIGTSTSFEATLGYQIRQAETGDLVTEGTATGGANGQYAPFSFTVDLEPGHYTVVVFAPDMSGANPLGEGDSKTWFVD